MKKIVLSIALVAMMGVSFVSCKETAKEPAQEEVTTETVAEEAPVTEEVATEEVTEEVATEEAPATEEVKAEEVK
ncbi:hypothetical protein [Myroides phaeus]|uniref:Uncharacterized protein n=1 Tax=Myroides phaeus TaxID=702745 RepID=A0A1G8EBB1_9FLAO|nr:hypothetical protein [Myroides phaeus]MEC4115999.1 hypothetical protein [Myroides phaeus]SDH67173.1 hypothetical protein SAMN05421818_11017 [Myroides phaeus]